MFSNGIEIKRTIVFIFSQRSALLFNDLCAFLLLHHSSSSDGTYKRHSDIQVRIWCLTLSVTSTGCWRVRFLSSIVPIYMIIMCLSLLNRIRMLNLWLRVYYFMFNHWLLSLTFCFDVSVDFNGMLDQMSYDIKKYITNTSSLRVY